MKHRIQRAGKKCCEVDIDINVLGRICIFPEKEAPEEGRLQEGTLYFYKNISLIEGQILTPPRIRLSINTWERHG